MISYTLSTCPGISSLLLLVFGVSMFWMTEQVAALTTMAAKQSKDTTEPTMWNSTTITMLNNSSTKPTTQNSSTTESSTQNSSTTELTTRNSSTTEPTTRNSSTTEPTTRNSSTSEPTTRNSSTSEPTTRNSSTSEPTTRNSSTTEPTTRNNTTTKPTTENPGTTIKSSTTHRTSTTCEPTTIEHKTTAQVFKITTAKTSSTTQNVNDQVENIAREASQLNSSANFSDVDKTFTRIENVLQARSITKDSVNKTINAVAHIVNLVVKSNQSNDVYYNSTVRVINVMEKLVNRDDSGLDYEYVEKLETGILDLTDKVLEGKGVNDEVRINNTALSLVAVKKSSTYKDVKLSTNHGEVEIPSNLFAGGNMKLKLIAYKSDPFKENKSADDNTPSSVVMKILLVDDKGNEITKIDKDEPVKLVLKEDGLNATNRTQMKINSNSTVFTYRVKIGNLFQYVVDIQLNGKAKKYTVLGKLKVAPSADNYDFYYSSELSQKVVRHPGVRVLAVKGFLRVFIDKDFVHASAFLYIGMKIEDEQTVNPSRKFSTGNPAMAPLVKTLQINPLIWDMKAKVWEKEKKMKVLNYSGNAVHFESTIFGAFSFKITFIEPNLIDFEVLFKDFEKKLKSNPWVLSVVLIIWLLYIGLVILLRRLDKSDKFHWACLPLIDNSNNDEHLYLLRVYTGLRSPRKLSSTPYFILKGHLGQTSIRILEDGVRKNFLSGSMSTFVMRTASDLGELYSVKIWHNNEGNSPRWFLRKITVKNISTRQIFFFNCKKWLALDKKDGLICREIGSTKETNSPGLFEVFADHLTTNLFDNHLWVSVIKRPQFSRFTRVQRLTCLVSILSLSMLVSAMWYDSGQTMTARGLRIGVFEITYREVFVGLVGSLITLLPGALISIIFRLRKMKNEQTESPVKTSFRQKFKHFHFPWWFVFVGYAVAFLNIAISSTFVLFYSISWGRDVSLQWLISLFFNTTGSVFLVQPLKVFVLALVFSCVISSLPEDEDEIMEPQNFQTHVDVQNLETKICPPPDINSAEFSAQRREIQQDRKLSAVFKSLSFRLLYVFILAIFCLHVDVSASFRQNRTMKNMFQLNKLNQTKGIDEIWLWLRKLIIPALFPLYSYNGDIMTVYNQRFVADMYGYRLGAVRFQQLRVKEDICNRISGAESLMKFFHSCYLDYSSTTKQTKQFSTRWAPLTNTTSHSQTINSYFKYTSASDNTYTAGTFAKYDSGGYIMDMNVKYHHAVKILQDLKTANWLDRSTRAIIINVGTYNVNSRLFTQSQVLIEQPAVGSIIKTGNFYTFRLHPYVSALDFFVLLLQLAFLVTTISKLVCLFRQVCKHKLSYLSRISTLIQLMSVCFSIMGITVYCLKISETTYLLEDLLNNKHTFVSSTALCTYDMLYIVSITLLLFIAILELLEPLTFNYYFFQLKASLALSKESICSYSFVIFFPLSAFSFAMFFIERRSFYFKNVMSSYMTLFKILLSMGKFRDMFVLNSFITYILFLAFTFFVTIIMLNIFVSIINFSFTLVKDEVTNKKFPFFYDNALSEHLWNRLFSCFRGQRRNSDEKANISPVNFEDPMNKGFHVFVKFEQVIDSFVGEYLNEMAVAHLHLRENLLQVWHCPDQINLAEAKLQTALTKTSFVEKSLQGINNCVGKERQLEMSWEQNGTLRSFLFFDSVCGKEPILKITVACSGDDDFTLSCMKAKEDITNLPLDETRKLLGLIIAIYPSRKLSQEEIQISLFSRSKLHPYLRRAVMGSFDDSHTWEELAKNAKENVESELSCLQVYEGHFPTHLVLVSCMKEEQFSIGPDGGEVLAVFEPLIRIVAEPGTFLSVCTGCLQLEPHEPLPIIHLCLNDQLPCKHLNFQFSRTFHGDISEKQVFESHCSDGWRETDTYVTPSDDDLIFKAKPDSYKISYLVKSTDIKWNWREQETPEDPVNEEFLTCVAEKIGGQWKELAKYLKLTGYKSKDKDPASAACNMLLMWMNSCPMSVKKVSILRAALDSLKHLDLLETLNEREKNYERKMSEMLKESSDIKCLDFLCRSPELCRDWRKLAAQLGLQEAVMSIEEDKTRSNREKCFLLLSQWKESQDGRVDKMALHNHLITMDFTFLAGKIKDL